MSSNNIKCAFNLFRSSSNTFKQSSLIFYGDQEILPPIKLPFNNSIGICLCLQFHTVQTVSIVLKFNRVNTLTLENSFTINEVNDRFYQ